MTNSWRTDKAPIINGVLFDIVDEPFSDELLDEGQVADLLGVARTSFVNYRTSGRLKIPFHSRNGSPAYFWSDIKDFMRDPANLTWKLARNP